MAAVRSNSVLPAQRTEIELHTADDLRLVGELASPLGGAEGAAATLLTLHPLPTHGGFMDSHVYKKAANRLPAMANLNVLRFNTRGTTSARGTSEGGFEEGVGERHDVAALVDFSECHDLPRPWLVGWSFGTELILMHGREPGIEGAILLSPPLHRASDADLDAWAAFGKPVHILVPEHDDYLQPTEAVRRFSRIPQARVIPVAAAKHLWVGETFVQRVLSEIVKVVNPAALPLPTEWAPAEMTQDAASA
ncbi:alpha/beta fold hydrolase [Micrococcales bacterium 31B]|nr:alpha/beta fold hydrolase [Micrococcales bacterium 31B]